MQRIVSWLKTWLIPLDVSTRAETPSNSVSDEADLKNLDLTHATGEEPTLSEEIYQIGYSLGKHWAWRDASSDQLRQVEKLGDGKDWAAFHRESAMKLRGIVGSDRASFLGGDEDLSPSFLAGFIDGVQALQRFPAVEGS
jgi:hypothetical protein